MSKKNSSKQALLLIGGSEVIGQGAAIIRRLIILRTIGVENYGIAVPMLLVLGLLNRIIDVNPSSTIVQDRKGSTRRFRDALQMVSVLRGVVFFVIVALLAVPLAVFNDLNSREYVMGFMFISLIPLIQGMYNIDIYRQLRRRQYKSTAVATAAAPVASTVMVAILCMFMSSFWVPLIGRFIHVISAVVISFLMAKRRYRLRWDVGSVTRILKFSVPLIIGGVVVFMSQRGAEQLLSASNFLFDYSIPKTEVGTLAAAVVIAMIPGTIGSKLTLQVFSPKIAEIRRKGSSLVHVFEQIQSVSLTIGSATMIMLQGGAVIIPILLTEKFQAAGPFLVALSLFGALRISGASTRAFALATGRSKIIMYSNICSLLGLVCSVWVVYNQRDLIEIAYCMAIGEASATIFRGLMIKRMVPSLSMMVLFTKPFFVLLCAFGVGVLQRNAINELSVPTSVGVIIISVAVGAGALSLAWSPVRSKASGLVRSMI
mgnify:CR=1 FL=1